MTNWLLNLLNLHSSIFRLTSISDSESNPGECVTLTAELAAHKEKLQREAITLWDGKDQKSEVRIVLQGRVLGE